MYGTPLRPTTFAVYASVILFGLAPEFRTPKWSVHPDADLRHNCNTRYGRLVRTYPTGTCTLQEHQSLTWRTPKPPFKNFYKAALTLAGQLLFCEKRVFQTFQEKVLLWNCIGIYINLKTLWPNLSTSLRNRTKILPPIGHKLQRDDFHILT